MKGMWKGRRALSLLLALVLTLSLLPPYAIPVYSNENDAANQPFTVTDPGNYSDLIGCNAELNFDSWTYLVISDDPAVLVENGQELVATDIVESVALVVEDCHWVEETCALWLKVRAADGYTLPDKLQKYPWIFQNYTDVYEEDDWQNFSADALRISLPAYSEPATIVSDAAVTVSSDNALFTDLIVTQTQAPSAYYISNAVAYNMTPRTNEGKYTGHADVSIPIPEDWDSEKVFGFVVEDDGTITVLLGTVTKFGTYQFTVPHFSEVGLLEATAVDDLENINIYFNQVSEEREVTLETTAYPDGKYTSADGAVEYVIRRNSDQAYVSFKGLDVTAGTVIVLNGVSYVITVDDVSKDVNKLLTGGSANSTTLDALYDLGVAGDYQCTYKVIKNESACITLADSKLTAVNGVTGDAVVEATVTNAKSGNVVGKVTYYVTVTNVEVEDVKKIYVPKGKNVTVSNLTGALNESVVIDATVATVSYAGNTLTISGVSDSGETYAVVGNVLFRIIAEPENSEKTSYLYISITTLSNTTVYYAINGGNLHKVEEGGLLVGVSNENGVQEFPGGVNIMFFSAPDDGFATTKYTAVDAGDFYSLVDGVRFDGADSSAWPFVDPDQSALPVTGDGSVDTNSSDWKIIETMHGFRWCLAEGNMSIAEMRDLFTRALALGCDSAINFTKNGGQSYITTLSVEAQRLPTLHKIISSVTKSDGSKKEYTADNPYDGEKLEIGDTIEYTIQIIINSNDINYTNLVIDDYQIGQKIELATISQTREETLTYKLTEDDIDKYANGEFWNDASLSYSYSSAATKGSNVIETRASVKCNIACIITWEDGFGNVLKVKEFTLSNDLDSPTVIGQDQYPSNPSATAYTFTGWDREPDFSVTTTDSVTIKAEWETTKYNIHYDLVGGKLGSGSNNPQEYTIEQIVELSIPLRAGHIFTGWEVTELKSQDNNWVVGTQYPGGYKVANKYGDVVLTAQWIRVSTTLTIGVVGCEDIDANQTFLFQVTGNDGVNMVATVHGNSTVTIDGLTDNGVYTVTQLTDWSWRYEATGWSYGSESGTGENATITVSNDGAITFTNQRQKTQWLDADTWLDNLFNGS